MLHNLKIVYTFVIEKEIRYGILLTARSFSRESYININHN